MWYACLRVRALFSIVCCVFRMDRRVAFATFFFSCNFPCVKDSWWTMCFFRSLWLVGIVMRIGERRMRKWIWWNWLTISGDGHENFAYTANTYSNAPMRNVVLRVRNDRLVSIFSKFSKLAVSLGFGVWKVIILFLHRFDDGKNWKSIKFLSDIFAWPVDRIEAIGHVPLHLGHTHSFVGIFRLLSVGLKVISIFRQSSAPSNKVDSLCATIRLSTRTQYCRSTCHATTNKWKRVRERGGECPNGKGVNRMFQLLDGL